VPNDKRARHKAARQAKLAELRRAQQRRRNLKRGAVVGAIVAIALILAFVTTLIGGGSGKKKPSHVATSSGTTVPSATTTTPTTTPAAVAAEPLSKVETYLTARRAPARSANCTSAGTAPTAPTTTVPAKGNAVSIVAAPAGVGFPNLDGSSPRYTKFSSAPPFCIDVNDSYSATMKTTAGTIKIELLAKYAPVTVNDFVFLAGYHYFDGIVFHRVIPGFVDQGGDPTGTGTGGPGFTVPDEYPKSNAAYDSGSVAMANTGKPDTGGSQFFLVVGHGGQQLSAAYTMFGQITSGLSAADKINAGGDSADNGDPPKITYKIESVSISATPTS
jgi:cyclophilin family peptidyl-prolyl cis-trans isomerase